MPASDLFPPIKVCLKCNVNKPIEDFGKVKKSLDGRNYRCKDCHNKANRDYYKANKAKVDAKNRAWHIAHPDAAKKYNKKWRLKNPEKARAAKQKWNQENKEKIASQKESWRKANREKDRMYASVRRARKRQNGIYEVTSNDILSILSKPCTYCGLKSDCIDHVIPLAKGGTHSIGNLVAACTDCNQSKGSKFLLEWKLSRIQ